MRRGFRRMLEDEATCKSRAKLAVKTPCAWRATADVIVMDCALPAMSGLAAAA